MSSEHSVLERNIARALKTGEKQMEYSCAEFLRRVERPAVRGRMGVMAASLAFLSLVALILFGTGTPETTFGAQDELVDKLGAEDLETRDQAEAELEKLGPKALDALEKAAKEHDDPQVRARALKIADGIRKAIYWARIRVFYWPTMVRGAVMMSDAKGAFAELKGSHGRTFAVTPDGKTLLITDDKVLKRMDAPFQGKPRWIADVKGIRLLPSPDGRRVFVGKGPGHVVDLATGKVVRVPSFDYSGGSWLDIDRIVYPDSMRPVLRIWNVKTGGKPVEHASSGPLALFRAAGSCSPDGKVVCVDGTAKTRNSGLLLFEPESKKWTLVEISGVNGNDRRVWSPKSDRLAYPRKSALVVYDIRTAKKKTVVAEKVHDVLGWIDSTTLVYLHLDRKDLSHVQKYGHGYIPHYYDLVALDVRSGGRVFLTTGGALEGEVRLAIPR